MPSRASWLEIGSVSSGMLTFSTSEFNLLNFVLINFLGCFSFESILLSISIGVGSDFVLHASHSYSMAPENCARREERTRYAVLHIGPPILGSAFTTLSTAIIMMFAENQFSRKFGTILIVTILQSIIGSFVVFFALCDCFGPSKNHNLCSGRQNPEHSRE